MRIIVADDVLAVAAAILAEETCGPLPRRIAQAGMLVGGYVEAGVLSSELALVGLAGALPLIAPQAHYGLVVRALEEGQAHAMPLADLDQATQEWILLLTEAAPLPAAAPPSPRPVRRRSSLDKPPDFVDPWLGRRDTWCGIPLTVRRVAHD